ncbi:MAG: hypothetical protein PHP03_01035 [Candidatus Pacebacteria bacterium]|nr:hypothetical protein [Candidatus Paceibacterota bacterium]
MHKIISFVLAESSKPKKGEALTISAIKSAPHYFEASVPVQSILKETKDELNGKEVDVKIKFYQPDVLLVEAEIDIEDVFANGTLDIKAKLLDICYKYVKKNGGNEELSEEYAIYVVSKYEGDPEQFLIHSNKIAGLLKSEKLSLAEQEIQHTLSFQLKYEKGDLTIIDWDGAFIFDRDGAEIGEDLELCELANYQLLKHRILDRDLDERSQKIVKLIKKEQPKSLILGAGGVNQAFKEVIDIRSRAIAEFESMDRDIKLIGDWYSARFYDLLHKKLRLHEWHQTIKEKLDSLEDAYSIVSENLGFSHTQQLERLQIRLWFILQAGWLVLIVLEFLAFFKD